MDMALCHFASGTALPPLPPELCERIRTLAAPSPWWCACEWCGALVLRLDAAGQLVALHSNYRIVRGVTQCGRCSSVEYLLETSRNVSKVEQT